jgi:molybdenum cofactor cytidylyltransferase
MSVPLYGFLLAAGESRRMGGFPKPLLAWGKSNIGRTILETMVGSSLEHIGCVVGHQAEAVKESLGMTAARHPGRRIEFVENPDYKTGMLGSIQCAVQYARRWSGTDFGLMLLLIDQPDVTAAVIDALAAAFREGTHPIVVPTHAGRRGHPVVIHSRLGEEILRLDPAVGLKQLMQAHASDRREVPVNTAAVHQDLDTPEEYRKAAAAAAGPGPDLDENAGAGLSER